MYSPRELEGEVDHSFFDSDCDNDGSIRKDGGQQQVEKRSEAEKGSLPVPDHIQASQSQSPMEAVRGSDGAQTPEGAKNPQNEGEEHHISEVDDSEDGYSSAVEDMSSGSSSTSSITCLSDTADGSDVEPASSRSKSPGGSDLSLWAEYKKEDYEDGYHQSRDESEEEEEGVPASWKFLRLKGVRVSTPTPTEESEDSVTDVTPLSTPEISPLKSLDLTQGPVFVNTAENAENGQLTEPTELESAPSSGLVPQEDESSEDVDKSSLGADSLLESERIFHSPTGRNRKNFSFTNDEVRRIDRENQRLLHELSRPPPRSRPASSGSVGGKSNTGGNPSATLNRQREQNRIEKDNLNFLKKLESIKSTAGLRRSNLLADYQRLASYPGSDFLPVYESPARKEKASSKRPSGKGSRPPTAAPRVTRPAWVD